MQKEDVAGVPLIESGNKVGGELLGYDFGMFTYSRSVLINLGLCFFILLREAKISFFNKHLKWVEEGDQATQGPNKVYIRSLR